MGHLMKSLVKPWKILCFSYVETMFYVGVRGVKGAKRKPLDGVSASGGGTSNRNKKLFYDANVVKLLVLTKFLSVFFRLIVKKIWLAKIETKHIVKPNYVFIHFAHFAICHQCESIFVDVCMSAKIVLHYKAVVVLYGAGKAFHINCSCKSDEYIGSNLLQAADDADGITGHLGFKMIMIKTIG